MNKLCRACAKDGKKLSSIFTKAKRKSKILDDLNFILQGHESIKIKEGDAFPKDICQECLKNLLVAVNFVRDFILAQSKLKRICQETVGVNKASPRRVYTRVKKNPIPQNETILSKDSNNPLEVEHLSHTSDMHHSSDDDDIDQATPLLTSPRSIKLKSVPLEEKLVTNLNSIELSSIENLTSPVKESIPNANLTKHDKIYQCSYCQRTFASKPRLRYHLRIHTGERPFICKTCNKAFAQANALKCHIRLHTGEKPYKCPFESCGKSFVQNTTLKTHMAALHTGKTVKCDSCEKTFTRASYLTAHKRIEHLGQRAYACHICPNRYKQKSHLDQHLEVHQGIKYECPICLKQYSKKWSLQVHSHTHLKESNKGKLPHACTECDESFERRDRLAAHRRKKHGEEGKKTKPKKNITKHETVEVPVPSNVVEVVTRPIILHESAISLSEFEGRQYHVFNVSEEGQLIEEIEIDYL